MATEELPGERSARGDRRSRARWVVVFESVRARSGDDGYEAAAAALEARVASAPGYLGMSSVRDGSGHGVTISFWESEEAIARWKSDVAHRAARARGRKDWYESFHLTIARIERMAFG